MVDRLNITETAPHAFQSVYGGVFNVVIVGQSLPPAALSAPRPNVRVIM